MLRRELPGMLQRLGVASLLDVPCGDLFWLRQTPLQLERYVGGDIVPPLIERNRSEYPQLFGARTDFQVLDLMTSQLPKCDAIMCRDCLVHLSHAGVAAALANIKQSGATYLLSTTFTSVEHNRDILTGEWRPLNLSLPPFSLPPPLELLLEECTEEGGKYADKCLGVWRVADISLRRD